ncbi:MAG: curved DNA-binding protein CbpA [Crocinitomix sp.]|jgi:curved DNA-binding protein CbpA
MSKRALKKYLTDLSKADLEEQITELYNRLKEVKEFYNFVFNPKEDKLLDEAKFKVSKEYFPPGKRRAKKRRSVAQNFIKNFIKLGVEPMKIGDLMLYNIEIAQTYNASYPIKAEAFYKSILKSFNDAITYIDQNGLESHMKDRINRVVDEAILQNWINKYAFEMVLDKRY